MKLNLLYFSAMIIVFQLLTLSCTYQEPEKYVDPVEFQNPPDSFSVRTFWHWMANNITQEGITKDLESMKRQGIVSATIINAGLLENEEYGITPVKFNTDEWFEMFQWALKEANRLGIKIGIHNCEGWSTSGGPWITPENSMKQCVWSKTFIAGGKSEYSVMPPTGNHGFYEDIKIYAYPAKRGLSSFQQAKPQISLDGQNTGKTMYDGDPFTMANIEEGSEITIEFEDHFTARQLSIHPRKYFQWRSFKLGEYVCELLSSKDGKHYETIGLFDSPEINNTNIIDIAPTEAKYFKVRFKEFNDFLKSNPIGISELELLDESEKPLYHTEIPNHLEKTGGVKPESLQSFFSRGLNSAESINPDEIIDVSGYLSGDSLLSWAAPQGDWVILRVGYTTTGSKNYPASKSGLGLECDKMDTTALNLHFDNFPMKLISAAGDYTGNTFEYLFIDSWECKFQNWTRNFPEEFKKRRGYDIYGMLPVVCGEIVGNADLTERFLHDYWSTIAEMIEEYYYKHFSDLCTRHHLKSRAEVIYGNTNAPAIDVMRTNSYMDVPMSEFWASSDISLRIPDYTVVDRPQFALAAETGALYKKSVVAAEGYTGWANFSASPWNLKQYGDRAYCAGVNQMELHSYVHQPFEKKPGFTLSAFGQTFNRHNPWWEFSSQWLDYSRRIQYVLQKGVTVKDILYFTGDRFHYNGPSNDIISQLHTGVNIQKCNLDILKNHCKVKDGKLVLDNGLSYQMLFLPDDNCMELATLQTLASLVKNGAVLVGPRPVSTLSYLNHDDNNKELGRLADQLWGESTGKNPEGFNRYGAGKVYELSDYAIALDHLNITPDFSVSDEEGGHSLLYIHKKNGKEDYYFVVNQEYKTVERNCTFRVSGKHPEIWDPVSGLVKPVKDYDDNGETTSLRIELEPKETLFIVFKDVPSNVAEEKPVYPIALSKYQYTLTFDDLPDLQLSGADSLPSWTSNADPKVKYYSGVAKYRINFDSPEGLSGKKIKYLSLGQLSVAGEVTLNGQYLGNVSFPDFRFDVEDIVLASGNLLEVNVANDYRNRIIGDLQEFNRLKDLWVTSTGSIPSKDSPLYESGLLGPITLFSE